jgi:hypothetical protein
VLLLVCCQTTHACGLRVRSTAGETLLGWVGGGICSFHTDGPLSPFGLQLDEYGMVAFVPLDITEEESLEHLLLQVDHVMQYGAWQAQAGVVTAALVVVALRRGGCRVRRMLRWLCVLTGCAPRETCKHITGSRAVKP